MSGLWLPSPNQSLPFPGVALHLPPRHPHRAGVGSAVDRPHIRLPEAELYVPVSAASLPQSPLPRAPAAGAAVELPLRVVRSPRSPRR